MLDSSTQVSCCIDWFSVTSDKMVHPDLFTKAHTELSHGRLNYNTGIEYTDGRIELWHNQRPEMKTHLIMSGETLAKMVETYKITALEIITFYTTGRASRIDIAVDIKHGCLDIKSLRDILANGEVDTKAVGGLYLSGLLTTEGDTLYIGSPKAARRLRIYDKAAEQNFDGQWTRIELQTRQSQARRTLATIIAHNDISVIPALINDFANWESDKEWGLVMGVEKMKPTPPEPLNKNRRAWLLDTVAKSLANEIQYGVGQSIIGELLDQTAVEIDVLQGKIKQRKT